MPENIKPVIIQTNVSTETLDTNGKNFPSSTTSKLSDIFDKIEGGQKADEAIDEVMAKPDEKKIEPKAGVPPEPKPEVKAEDKTALEKTLESQQDKKDGKVVAEGKPEVKVEEKKTEDEVPQEELQVLPHDKPKTAKRIQALLGIIEKERATISTTKKEAEDKAQKLAELEKKLSEVKTVDPVVDETIKAKLDELNMHRRRYELEKDPEVKSKFDDRIVELDNKVPDILKNNNAGDGLLNLIKNEGGWKKFTRSNKQVNLADGTTVSAAELADKIIKNLPFSDRNEIESITMEQVQTEREKARFFAEQQKAAGEYFKQKEAEAAKGGEAYQKQIKDAQDAIENWRKEFEVKSEWLKEKEVPSSATPEQKLAIEEENKFTKQLKGVLEKNIKVKDMKGMLEVVQDSVQYHQQRRENAKLIADNKRLTDALSAKQAELDKFKNAGRSTPKGGSLTGAGTSAAPTKDEKPKSLEAAFDAIAAGEAV